ncbi:DNA-binding NarL/FixJ family response regulator [Dysgonomonadaceae bacterium PH5-43]|nr:DNA-binding NarL/FixJ family response regulator [Dysgonomonadaceae bacterium PH5-43]
MSRTITVLIVEPSLIIRRGMLSVLQQLNSIRMNVFEVAAQEQLKNTLNWKKPDIVIVNSGVPGQMSIQEIRKESANPNIKCISLQNSLSDNATLKLYDENISIYDSIEQIEEKINNLFAQPKTEDKGEQLTQREKEIIVCVIKGLKNKEIADKLCLSTHTVVSHRRNIASKLNIHSSAGLTIYAIVNKLVELDDIKG